MQANSCVFMVAPPVVPHSHYTYVTAFPSFIYFYIMVTWILQHCVCNSVPHLPCQLGSQCSPLDAQ